MRKGELGLQRIEKLNELKKRYEDLKAALRVYNDGLIAFGYKKKIGEPKRVISLLDMIFESFPAVEFLDKDRYCYFIREIAKLEAIEDNMRDACRVIGSDFCSFSLCEFYWLASELLEVATYDSLICPDYPCTSEIICNGNFSYYNIGDETTEIIIDTPEKCWDYLKESYDALED